MSKLYLYSIFHLNLAFSSIPRDDYPLVIERCYWPLLELAEEGIPVGIEATAHTLKEIERVDGSFIKRLAELWKGGRCEFIGSGYSQIIMPLAPSEVNIWNLEIGNRHYREFFGRTPEVFYINEQTFSRGLVDLFKRAGCSTIVMDWNNCCRYNNYQKELLFFPQKAEGVGCSINVLWNHSIAFQKFQRCVYGDIAEKEYLEFLFSNHSEEKERAFLVYGNDAEVFGYRPGHGAADRDDSGNMKKILERIARDGRAVVTAPSGIVRHFEGHPLAFRNLRLESSRTPVVVKKQEKYNPTRWAVTGRDSAHINAECYKVYQNLKALGEYALEIPPHEMDGFRQTLCELWGSDFRTNTIDEKFLYFHNKLGWLKLETERLLEEACSRKRLMAGAAWGGVCGLHSPCHEFSEDRPAPIKDAAAASEGRPEKSVITRRDNVLKVSTGAMSVEFLENKGMALKSVTFPEVSSKPLMGTLSQGHYEDISLGVDFFSGHLIHVTRDGKKTTDLVSAAPQIEEHPEKVSVKVRLPLDIGTLWKRYDVWKTDARLSVTYRLKVNGLVSSSLRLGIFTFIPSGLDKDSLWLETVNGGCGPERFSLKGASLSQDEPVSQSVSASGCLGATEGWVKIGDRDKSVMIRTDKSKLFSVPMVNYTELDPEETFFLRLYHSVGEVDDTAWWVWRGYNEITFDLTAKRN